MGDTPRPYIEIDDREAIYLGTERYLAGEVVGRQVVSWVPGTIGRVESLDALVEVWRLFADDPRYEFVRHPEQAREHEGQIVRSDASDGCGENVRGHLRSVLGRDERQAERMRKTNEKRKKELSPW